MNYFIFIKIIELGEKIITLINDKRQNMSHLHIAIPAS